ncbi:MAG TPA: hypothetical protein VNZ01_13560 [Solirubrobacteraceae bacterium]|nr:hypothetical protein [Solirubrobacteraceae bacterium]
MTFGIDPSTSSVCTISGSTVSFIGSGTCKVNANQAGSTEYEPAPQKQQSITVVGKAQTIEFTSTPPSPGVVGGTAYNVTASGGGSGNAVTFGIDPSTSSVCTISGSTVSFIGSGTCKVNANQAGNTEYEPAPQKQQSVTVVGKAQAIAFTSSAPTPATVGGPTYQVTATGGGSPNPVIFSIDPSTTSVCTISVSTVTFTGAGTCKIDANQGGTNEYESAPQAQQSVTVVGKPQAIEFTSTSPTAAVVGGPTYKVAATGGGSPNPVTFNIDPSTSSVCTISGSTVSFIGAGTCTIDANQAGNSEYEPAPQATQSFTVAAAPTVITVVPGPGPPPPPPPPGPKPSLGNSNFTAGASSFEPKTGRVIFIETITNPGTFSWLLTFPNGKFALSGRRCGAGLVRLGGKCRPAKIIFAMGSATVPAGVVIFKLRPSPAGLKALRNALRLGKGLRVTATFTFQSSLGGSPVSHTQKITDKLKKK